MSEATRQGEPRRLYQVVADRIRASIQDGRFAPSSRLPGERELAQVLGVSRPSLREALIALEIEGSIDVRMGSGIYVTATPPSSVATERSLGDSPSEIMQTRLVIEGAVAVMACAKVDEAALQSLRRHHEAMCWSVQIGQVPLEGDRAFHMTLAAQAGNSVIERLIGELFDARQSAILATLSNKFESDATWRAALDEHEAILLAVEASDPLRAEAAMRMHLQCSAERWLGR
jgi:GntR family transcriptional repressor for pyruvate dehydrogenase complex